jgi:hypothetical protein
MNSEREKRQQLAEHLSGEIDALENVTAISERTLEALKAARGVLSEVPRKLTNCRLELQRFNISLVVERGTCSACGEVSMGWEVKWAYCPVCGSRITEAVKESDPRERLQREAVEREIQTLGVR